MSRTIILNREIDKVLNTLYNIITVMRLQKIWLIRISHSENVTMHNIMYYILQNKVIRRYLPTTATLSIFKKVFIRTPQKKLKKSFCLFIGMQSQHNFVKSLIDYLHSKVIWVGQYQQLTQLGNPKITTLNSVSKRLVSRT